MCQIDTIPPTSAEASIRKQIAERNNVSESYVVRSEKFMRGVQIMDQMIPGMQEKILSGQFKVRDADMHRLARADFPNRKQIVHEILHPEDRPAPQKRIYGINYSALEAVVRRIQQDVDFLMKYLPKVPDDAYVKVETTKILKQHKAYMAQFEELLNEAKRVWEHRDTYKTAAQAIGYKEFFPYFAGESALAPCVEKLKQASRNYAKRQLTWFRHMEGICWLDASAPDVREQAAHLTNEFLAKG